MSTHGDDAYPKTPAPPPHQLHRPLIWLSALMAINAVACLILVFAAPVQILGVNGWIKPLKFAVSIGIFAFTIALVIRLLPARRWISRVGTGIAVLLLLEQIIIMAAVARGTTSHFNAATPLTQALYSIMGVSIAVVWMLTLALGVMVWCRSNGAPDQVSALRSGMIIGLIGMGLAFLMTMPTDSQLADMQGVIGAHAVGVADGGPGLPILGWSTLGGDLRIPHFIGMHALQVLPILAYLIGLIGTRRAALSHPLVRRQVIRILAATYAGITAIVTWQALIGESIVQPSTPILAATIALLVASTASVVVVVLRGGRATTTTGTTQASESTSPAEELVAS